ncbi:MAG TPA: DUF2269 family protein [Gemmatimonadaceae bacterium]|nr:DUF2269 family protein [Gemmatimonadaceae bacterium]
MLALYGVLKVVHVLSVVVWIGGAIALGVVTRRLALARDRAALTAVLPQTLRYGQRMAGPSSGLVLLTGIAMVGVGRIGFGTFWVVWGFIGMLLHFAFGATVMRKRTIALSQMLAAAPADEARLLETSSRLWVGNVIYLLIMASVIVVMVLKPTL